MSARCYAHAAKNARLESWKRVALQDAIDAVVEAERALVLAGIVPPPAYRAIAVAQFLIESGWGKHDAGGARNYFGIKAVDAQPYVERRTEEVIGGKRIVTVARFRRFASAAECFIAHGRLICGASRYRRFQDAGRDLAAAARALQACGYATDPEYAVKLLRVVVDRGLAETFGLPIPARP